MSKMYKEDLVSVIVITYNSSNFVIETLESIKLQSYKNIELIISDDGSRDNTAQLCEHWLHQNKEYFKNSKVLTVLRNTGIPANCNRGIQASHGNWIKLIAGDDVLVKDCILINLLHIKKHPEINVLQTISKYYNDTFDQENYVAQSPANLDFFSLTAKEQSYILAKKNVLIAPSVFISKAALLHVQGFDETFKLLEDITMWLNLTRGGIKIDYLDEHTVNYRLHTKSVAKQGKANISAVFCRELILFTKKYTLKSDKVKVSYFKKLLKYKLLIFFDKIGLNNNSVFSEYLYKITWKFL